MNPDPNFNPNNSQWGAQTPNNPGGFKQQVNYSGGLVNRGKQYLASKVINGVVNATTDLSNKFQNEANQAIDSLQNSSFGRGGGASAQAHPGVTPDGSYLGFPAYLPNRNPDPTKYYTYDPSLHDKDPSTIPGDASLALNKMIYQTKSFWPKNTAFPWEFRDPISVKGGMGAQVSPQVMAPQKTLGDFLNDTQRPGGFFNTKGATGPADQPVQPGMAHG